MDQSRVLSSRSLPAPAGAGTAEVTPPGMRRAIRRFMDRNGGFARAGGVALLLQSWDRAARHVIRWRERQIDADWRDEAPEAAATDVHDTDARGAAELSVGRP